MGADLFSCYRQSIFLLLWNLQGLSNPWSHTSHRMCEYTWNAPFFHEFLLRTPEGWKLKPVSSQEEIFLSYFFHYVAPFSSLDPSGVILLLLDLIAQLSTELLISLSLFFKDFLWCGLFLKSLLNLLQYCFFFYFILFYFFCHQACENLAPWSGIKLPPSALEGEVLTTGPQGKAP